jgi:hypothetical protein
VAVQQPVVQGPVQQVEHDVGVGVRGDLAAGDGGAPSATGDRAAMAAGAVAGTLATIVAWRTRVTAGTPAR